MSAPNAGALRAATPNSAIVIFHVFHVLIAFHLTYINAKEERKFCPRAIVDFAS
jgi:hypothetical protein